MQQLLSPLMKVKKTYVVLNCHFEIADVPFYFKATRLQGPLFKIPFTLMFMKYFEIRFIYDSRKSTKTPLIYLCLHIILALMLF